MVAFTAPAAEKVVLTEPELAIAIAPRPSPTARAGAPLTLCLASSRARASLDGLAEMSVRTEKLEAREAWVFQPSPISWVIVGPPAELAVLSVTTETEAPA